MMNTRHRSNKNRTENNIFEEIHECQDKELQYYADDAPNYFTYIYDFTNKCGSIIYNAFYYILNISGIYLIWIFLHFIASQLYINFCVPKTLYGFIMSPLMIPAPHCQGLRWIVYNSANIITNMWVIFGTWVCSVLLINNNKNPDV